MKTIDVFDFQDYLKDEFQEKYQFGDV